MNKLDTQLPQLQQPELPFITRHHIYGFVFLFVVFSGLIFLIYDWQYGKQIPSNNVHNSNPGNSSQVCLDVIQPARDIQTGEVRDFPTPCDVPEGWEVISPEMSYQWEGYSNPKYGITNKNNGYIRFTSGLNSESNLYLHIDKLQPDILIGQYRITGRPLAYNRGWIFYIGYNNNQQEIRYYDLTTQKDYLLASSTYVVGEIAVTDDNLYYLQCNGLNCKVLQIDLQNKKIETALDLIDLNKTNSSWKLDYYSKKEDSIVLIDVGTSRNFLLNLSRLDIDEISQNEVHLVKDAMQENDSKLCGERPGSIYDDSILGCFSVADIPQIEMEKGVVRGVVNLGQFNQNRRPAVYSSDYKLFLYDAELVGGKYIIELPVGEYIIAFREPGGTTLSLYERFKIEKNKEVVLDFNIP